MKKNLNFLMGAVLLMATVLFASCNAEDDFLVSPVDSTGAVTRSVTTDPYVIDLLMYPQLIPLRINTVLIFIPEVRGKSLKATRYN